MCVYGYLKDGRAFIVEFSRNPELIPGKPDRPVIDIKVFKQGRGHSNDSKDLYCTMQLNGLCIESMDNDPAYDIHFTPCNEEQIDGMLDAAKLARSYVLSNKSIFFNEDNIVARALLPAREQIHPLARYGAPSADHNAGSLRGPDGIESTALYHN